MRSSADRKVRVAFACALIIVCVSCSRPTTTAGIAIAPDLARQIPQNTRILAGVSPAKLRATPFYKDHPQLDALAQGFDFERDTSMVLVVWNDDQPLILTQDTRSHTDVAHGGLSEKISRQLRRLRTQDQIWVVSANGLPLIEMPKRTDIASALSNITGYVTATSAGLTVDTGLHLRADLTCISDAGAQRVRDAFRGGLGFARLMTKDAALQQLYGAVHVEQQQADVIIQADLSPELSDTLIEYLPSTASRTRLH